MDTRELLTHLEKLEYGLDHFSFRELKTEEAHRLKRTFESFKNGLEEKVFGVPEAISTKENEEQTKQQLTQESKLIANVSHEIRTPLNGITGFIDLLKETPLTREQKELVQAMDRASQNLLGVLNELLEFSSIAAGQEKFERISFKPANLINEVSFLCKTLINNDAVQLVLNYDEHIPAGLVGDPAKLSQILLNLLGNAVKFVEKGEIRLEVRLKARKRKKVYLEFVVSDTGIGIANEHLAHIFETYRQAEPDTKLKYGGSGLGLSIVKELIEKQQGCIAVSSALGVGTTFKVILPFQLPSSEQLNTAPPKKAPAEFTIKGKSILVLEDDALTQRLMENRLQQWGCNSYISENGLFGLQLLQNHKIDLVLLDMHLPGMNGFDWVARLRQDPQFAQLPIIILSGDAYTKDKDLFKELNINDFVLKPYNSEELQEKIYHHTLDSISTKNTENTAASSNNEDEKTLVDLGPITKECLGKIELLEELLRLFEQNILEFIGKTKMHLQSRNIQGVGFAAHKIKSSLKMLKTEGLIQICEEILIECRTSNNVEVLQTHFEKFVAEYPKVEMAIALEVKRLKYKL